MFKLKLGTQNLVKVLIFLIAFLIVLFFVVSWSVYALMPKSAEAVANPPETFEYFYKAVSMISISIAFGMAVVASGIGIAVAGSAAVSAAAEKPELTTLSMIITAFAEAIAIYGIVAVIMMLGKL